MCNIQVVRMEFLKTFSCEQLCVLTGVPSLGFCQPITIDTLREKRPLLDAVDHDRRPNVLVSADFCFKALCLLIACHPMAGVNI